MGSEEDVVVALQQMVAMEVRAVLHHRKQYRV